VPGGCCHYQDQIASVARSSNYLADSNKSAPVCASVPDISNSSTETSILVAHDEIGERVEPCPLARQALRP
jgi:hypothetical protein